MLANSSGETLASALAPPEAASTTATEPTTGPNDVAITRVPSLTAATTTPVIDISSTVAPDQHGKGALNMFLPADNSNLNGENNAIDLDDLFQDCYFEDFSVQYEGDEATSEPTPVAVLSSTSVVSTNPDINLPQKRSFDQIATTQVAAAKEQPQLAQVAIQEFSAAGPLANATNMGDNINDTIPEKQLTDQQKFERRERNREHAKRSRLRKKFLLESLQEQVHGLQSEIEQLKDIVRKEVPEKATELLLTVGCSQNRGNYTPLPMPSGFGPVKTLMEPDFRLMSSLSNSQQNFAISDPSLPDNPIVYVSQGFLELTGYKLDQVLGRNCRFLQGPGTDQSAVDVIRKGIREGIDTSVCLLNYKADGTPFWNQFFIASLRDAENNVVNYVGVQCEVSKAVVESQMKPK